MSMFSDKKNNEKVVQQQDRFSAQNVIAKGTKIIGDISSQGDLRIDGAIEGNVKTTGRVVVGKTGEINGSLEGSNAHFEGRFSGKIQLSGTLTLKESAHIQGEVFTQKLSADPGATFNVTCKMGGSPSAPNPAKQQPTNKVNEPKPVSKKA